MSAPLLVNRPIVMLVTIMTVVFLSGCEFKDVVLDRVDRFEINSLEAGKLDANIRLVLTNPNSFPITIKAGEFDIYSGKIHLGDAHLKRSFKISANSTKEYDVEVNGTIGDMLAAGITGLAGMLTGKKPEMTVKGELKAGNFFYTKKVPVELKTEMPLNL